MSVQWMHDAKHKEPKNQKMPAPVQHIYRAGLYLLGSIMPYHFIDIPVLKNTKDYNRIENGLYYTVPFYQDAQLNDTDDHITLLRISEILHGEIHHRMRIDYIYNCERNGHLFVAQDTHLPNLPARILYCQTNGESFRQAKERLQTMQHLSIKKLYKTSPYR